MLNIVWNNVSPTELRSAWKYKCREDQGWSKVTAPLLFSLKRKKPLHCSRGFRLCVGGADGTRTRVPSARETGRSLFNKESNQLNYEEHGCTNVTKSMDA
ncbi:hypothetical protein [Shewanella nanhaiensis]|uniref:Uncharacterized protein n=1 Tax=Shewanella nanhaiensis TaxID=2864872 RepID=A0ABS7E978_9GAMM|nr:hypothetical protein [Shewanella nanhaiensis]MBW8186124.1 hypothetical protein [Shewanella nanhaiensis]